MTLIDARHRVADRGADGLHDARPGAVPRRGVGDLGDVGVVHVAGEEDDRRRRAAAVAAGDVHDDVEDLGEALVEGRPVLEVDALAGPLGGRRDEAPVRTLGEHLVDGLEVVQPRRQEEGQRGADEEVLDVAGQLLVEPGHLVGVEHRAVVGVEHAGGAGVDDDEAAVAEVAAVAPAVDLGVPVDAAGQVEDRLGEIDLAASPPQRRPVAAGRGEHSRVDLVARQLGGRQVAEVLVDPVRRQPAHEPLVPPRRPVDLLVPGPRRVPVVADVVVVEDHAARQGREQPADRLVAPGESRRGGRTPRSP